MAEYTKIGNDIDPLSPIEYFYDLIPYTKDNQSFKYQWIEVSIQNEITNEVIDDEILTREDGAVSFSLPRSFRGTIELSTDQFMGLIPIENHGEEEDIAQMIFVEMKRENKR